MAAAPPAGGPLAGEHLSPAWNSLTVRETTLGALRMRQIQSVRSPARELHSWTRPESLGWRFDIRIDKTPLPYH